MTGAVAFPRASVSRAKIVAMAVICKGAETLRRGLACSACRAKMKFPKPTTRRAVKAGTLAKCSPVRTAGGAIGDRIAAA